MSAIGGIPIEPYQDDASWGVIRDGQWPVMISFRPEPWRFFRLARIVGAARAIAEIRLGRGSGDKLVAAMSEISDAKGDFSVGWMSDQRRPEFERIVDEALALEQEDDIVHFDESRD